MHEYSVFVLRDGYTHSLPSGDMSSACTITLIKGPHTILVDTGSAWDTTLLLDALSKYEVKPSDVNYVVCTHGHCDHVGNLNLFTDALHIVGFDIQKEDQFKIHNFSENIPYEIDDMIEIIPTPGHTNADVTVLVKDVQHLGRVAVAGDLFECREDLDQPELWQSSSENQDTQENQRRRILRKADYIIPGHGPMFKVEPHYVRHLSVEMM